MAEVLAYPADTSRSLPSQAHRGPALHDSAWHVWLGKVEVRVPSRAWKTGPQVPS